jgi:hypothetical protein
MTAKKPSKPTKSSPTTISTPVDTASKLDRTLDRAVESSPAVTPPVVAKSKSTIQSPVKVVWTVCEEMKSAARKDVVAECMKRGVNVHTAKTQYQRWTKRPLR